MAHPENLRSTSKNFYFKFGVLESASMLGRAQRFLVKSDPKFLLGQYDLDESNYLTQ
jgi:hypothetical protein